MMVSFSSGALSSDDSSKRPLRNGYMPKWKLRKVSAVRDFPPRCGPSAVPINLKEGENSASNNVDLEAGAIKNSDIGNAVMPSGDGIPKTALMEVEIENSENTNGTVNAGDKGSATANDRGSGGIIKDCFENSVMETGPAEMQLKNKVDGLTYEATNVPIQAERTESLEALVATQVDIFSNDIDELAMEAKVTGSDLLNNMNSDSSEDNTKGERDSTLKELNEMDGFPSVHNSGVEESKLVSEGHSHSLSSTRENTKPEYSVRLKIKFCHRKASAARDIPPTYGMSVSLPKEEETQMVTSGNKFLDNDENIEVEPETPLSSELHREVVHGLMAAPYCPWRKGKVAVTNTDSGGKTKQLKRKSVPVTSNSSPKQSSGGTSKRRAFLDRLDTEKIPGSSTLLDSEDGDAFTECPADITPLSTFNPGLDNSPGKSCNVKSSCSTFSSADVEDENLMSATISTLKKKKLVSSNSAGETSGEKVQENPSWRKKSKAVARKSICKGNLSGNKTKEDFPTDAMFSGKTKNANVGLPRFLPNNRNRADADAQSKVRETLRYFHRICRKLLQKEEASLLPEEECASKKTWKKPLRIDLDAGKIIKKEGREVNTENQILGSVPGVEVGDEFQYRVELALVGIHRLYQAGIDSMKLDGRLVATSIVTSGSYDDDTEHADVLIYTGEGGNIVGKNKGYKEGGNIVGKNKGYKDQTLERGNLALSNSKEKGTPVRVVRGWRETVKGTDRFDSRPKLVSIYYYDGLYTVKRCWTKKGSHGKLVYKFELTRNPNQPRLAWKELKKTSKSKMRQGVCVTDISYGREYFPICAVNLLDDEKPPKFTYISMMKYPNWHRPSPPMGCDCVGRCNGLKKCACAIRNGGEIPYNRNGAIVEVKPIVYECGPHCKCPPTCYNRVTQRGMKIRVEIFKTNRRGWGLRALTSIPSGSFICEYAGELLEDKEAEKKIGNDEYLFDIGQNYVDASLNYKEHELSDEVAEEGGFTIDACRYGNVGRFINHSCWPNLYAQNVIYDHDDKKMPHVMLFAAENIPPFKELTYDYNYKLGQVIDSNGNVKIKNCFCGSEQCSGRMY